MFHKLKNNSKRHWLPLTPSKHIDYKSFKSPYDLDTYFHLHQMTTDNYTILPNKTESKS